MEMNLFTFLPFFQPVGTIGIGTGAGGFFFSLFLKLDLHRLQGELGSAQRNAAEFVIQKPEGVPKV